MPIRALLKKSCIFKVEHCFEGAAGANFSRLLFRLNHNSIQILTNSFIIYSNRTCFKISRNDWIIVIESLLNKLCIFKVGHCFEGVAATNSSRLLFRLDHSGTQTLTNYFIIYSNRACFKLSRNGWIIVIESFLKKLCIFKVKLHCECTVRNDFNLTICNLFFHGLLNLLQNLFIVICGFWLFEESMLGRR